MKNHLFWFKAGAWMSLLTAAVHSLNFFSKPQPQNDTEKQLFDLLQNYKFNLGAGFERSMSELTTYFNLNMTFFLLFLGVVNLLIAKHFMPSVKDKVFILWNFVIFTANLAAACLLTFLPPIVMIALCWLFFGVALLTFKRA